MKRRLPVPAGVVCAGIAAVLLVAPCAARSAGAPATGALQARIDAAPAGTTLTLAAGTYAGPVVLRRPLAVQGDGVAIIDGGGAGSVVTVDAPDVVLRGLLVRNSGTDLSQEDSGIYVTEAGDRVRIEENRLEGNLIGIDLKGPETAVVRGNSIHGRTDLRINERGDGVHMWNTPGSVIVDNRISGGRDGIFVTTSTGNRFSGNHIAGVRFAVHYMYTNDSEVSDNVSRGNHVGYALMYSANLVVRGNRSQGDRDHGLMLHFANYSTIERNVVAPGPHKCTFVYNANGNIIRDNVFRGCDIGIHHTAGSADNAISGNAFIGSRDQVKYVGSRLLEWSVATDHGQRGNYWSDALTFDLDGDGIGERPYRPNTLGDTLIWRYPVARLLLNTPAWHLLAWAQRNFPALHPGGV
ncbi:MAG: nitrous oxide reductase family maturation protein NosD, partial [Gammaproteobacteria bacterium]